MKKCVQCKKRKPVEEFYKNSQAKDGIHYSCKVCESERKRRYHRTNINARRDRQLKRRYGISLDQYKDILKQQGGVCAICGRPETSKRKILSVDHDHDTGEIRELLCHSCNRSLGDLEENIETLQNMIEYLTKHSKK